MNSATATSVETSNGSLTQRKLTQPEVEPQNGANTSARRQWSNKKYRHVAAVHSKTRASALSHDSEVTPSFLGFRNLMVIVLGMLTVVLRGGVCVVINAWQWSATCD